MKRIEDDIKLSKSLFSYLKGELSEQEKQEVDTLLQEDEKLNIWFNQFKNEKYIDQCVRERNHVNLDEKWRDHLKRRKRKKDIRMFKQWVLSAASVILILGFGWWIYQQTPSATQEAETVAQIIPGSSKAELIVENGKRYVLPEIDPGIIDEEGTKIEHDKKSLSYRYSENEEINPPMHQVNVPRGGEYHLVLSDGTKVWLNSESSINYPAWFKGNIREVELKGEAYFDVSHNPELPFFVNTEKVKLEVLGTEFNIKAYGDEYDVATTLVEGEVKVNPTIVNASAVILKPGEQAVLKGASVKVGEVNTRLYTAWKDGLFIFKEESLEQMFLRMSRWYDFKVFFANQSVKQFPFTGTVDRKEGIENILKLLEQTQRVKFEINKNIILVKQ